MEDDDDLHVFDTRQNRRSYRRLARKSWMPLTGTAIMVFIAAVASSSDLCHPFVLQDPFAAIGEVCEHMGDDWQCHMLNILSQSCPEYEHYSVAEIMLVEPRLCARSEYMARSILFMCWKICRRWINPRCVCRERTSCCSVGQEVLGHVRHHPPARLSNILVGLTELGLQMSFLALATG